MYAHNTTNCTLPGKVRTRNVGVQDNNKNRRKSPTLSSDVTKLGYIYSKLASDRRTTPANKQQHTQEGQGKRRNKQHHHTSPIPKSQSLPGTLPQQPTRTTKQCRHLPLRLLLHQRVTVASPNKKRQEEDLQEKVVEVRRHRQQLLLLLSQVPTTLVVVVVAAVVVAAAAASPKVAVLAAPVSFNYGHGRNGYKIKAWQVRYIFLFVCLSGITHTCAILG